MTNLEFVESRIKFFEERIKEEEQEFKIMKTEDKHIINYYNKHIDILKEKKEIYEQIKTVLEAWEVVKKHCDYQDYDRFNCIQEGFYSIKLIKGKDFLIVKKALEVKDEN